MKFLTLKDLDPKSGVKPVPYHAQHIRRLVREGKFPLPVQLSPGRHVWLESDIDEWIREKIEQRNAKVASQKEVADANAS